MDNPYLNQLGWPVGEELDSLADGEQSQPSVQDHEKRLKDLEGQVSQLVGQLTRLKTKVSGG